MSDDARTAILDRIRSALADVPPDEDASTTSIARNYRPAATFGQAALIEDFVGRVAGYKVTVTRGERAEAARLIGEILARRGLRRLVIPTDFPTELWPTAVELVPDRGLDLAQIAAADGAITLCALAIAQTGTIVLDHGAGQGRRALTLLPDYHLCIVDAERVVSLVPEAIARTANAVRAGRPLTFISGPSATSDIELNRVEGVHGPRMLDVLIVGADAVVPSP